MEIGILGKSQCGKSTLFEIMTGVKSSEKYGEKFVRGIAKVSDIRFDKLVEIYKPKKETPPTVPFVDVNAEGDDAWEAIRKNLNTIDAYIHVLDAFTRDDLSEITADYRSLRDELVLSDLVVIEKKLEKLEKLRGKVSFTRNDELHFDILTRAKVHLEAGKPMSEMELTEEELFAIKGFSFWSLRPELVVLNVSDDRLGAGLDAKFREQSSTKAEVLEICCDMEVEISKMEPGEQKEFLDSLGVTTPAFGRIVRSSFSLNGMIYYFTVGEDEVRAWIIPEGTLAPRAASVIHKDFERGFIRAEVIHFDDFMESGGSEQAAKKAGKSRLEGKSYIVKDGDIIHFRFNV